MCVIQHCGRVCSCLYVGPTNSSKGRHGEWSTKQGTFSNYCYCFDVMATLVLYCFLCHSDLWQAWSCGTLHSADAMTKAIDERDTVEVAFMRLVLSHCLTVQCICVAQSAND